MHNNLNFLVCDGFKVTLFGKILAYKTVHVFICSSLPRCIGVSKVKVGIKLFADLFMFSKFFAVIGSQRVNFVCIRFEQMNNGVADLFGGLPDAQKKRLVDTLVRRDAQLKDAVERHRDVIEIYNQWAVEQNKKHGYGDYTVIQQPERPPVD